MTRKDASPYQEFVPEINDEDVAEEERQFYESLGDACARGLWSFNDALELLDSPFGLSHAEELATVKQNIQEIVDRAASVWDKR